jgi:hypothetical protein
MNKEKSRREDISAGTCLIAGPPFVCPRTSDGDKTCRMVPVEERQPRLAATAQVGPEQRLRPQLTSVLACAISQPV